MYIYFSIMLKEKCNTTYRNQKDFITVDHFTIDKGSLWNLTNGKLVLVDDDNYVETHLDVELFEESK